MDGISSFFANLLDEFSNGSSIEKFGFIPTSAWYLGLAFTIIGIILGSSRFRSNRKRLNSLLDEVTTLKFERDKALLAEKRACDARDNIDPATWLRDADKELSQGNVELAADRLSVGLFPLQRNLSQVALRLARHQFQLIIGPTPDQDLLIARNLAIAAHAFDPDSSEAMSLAGELESLHASLKGIDPVNVDFAPSSPERALSLISNCQGLGVALVQSGNISLARLTYQRAKLAAQRGGLLGTEPDFYTDHLIFQCALSIGEGKNIADEVDQTIKRAERLLSHDNPTLLSLEFDRCDVAGMIGEYDKALGLIEKLIPRQAGALGDENPNTLSCRFLEARLTSTKGNAEKGLQMIRNLLPTFRRIKGDRDGDVLACRHLEAENLSTLGRWDEGLDLVPELLSDFAEEFGSTSHFAFASRVLHSTLIRQSGDTPGSQKIFEELISDAREVLGPSAAVVVALEYQYSTKFGNH